MKDIKEITPYGQKDSKKAEVEDMFDNIAPKYDLLNRLLSLRIDNLWRISAMNELKPIQPKKILDVATGTADFAIQMRKLKPEQITGLDLSEQMLSFGRVKVKDRNLDDLITLVKGDSENLPFEDNSFDAITVAFGVRNFEHIEAGLAEMYRVLRPGGKLVVLEFSKPKVFPVKQLFYFYFHFILPIIGRMLSKDTRAYTYLPESVESFPEGEAFLSLLRQAGYKNDKCRALTFGISSVYTGTK